MFNGVEVEVEALRVAASAAREASETIVKAGELKDFGETIERALKGSKTARYAVGLETLLFDQLVAWSSEADGYQERMSDTADEYERVDDERTEDIRRAGGGK